MDQGQYIGRPADQGLGQSLVGQSLGGGNVQSNPTLQALEGRYVAPTGAGYQYYKGGTTNPPFNPYVLQKLLQQITQRQTQPGNQQQMLRDSLRSVIRR